MEGRDWGSRKGHVGGGEIAVVEGGRRSVTEKRVKLYLRVEMAFEGEEGLEGELAFAQNGFESKNALFCQQIVLGF